MAHLPPTPRQPAALYGTGPGRRASRTRGTIRRPTATTTGRRSGIRSSAIPGVQELPSSTQDTRPLTYPGTPCLPRPPRARRAPPVGHRTGRSIRRRSRCAGCSRCPTLHNAGIWSTRATARADAADDRARREPRPPHARQHLPSNASETGDPSINLMSSVSARSHGYDASVPAAGCSAADHLHDTATPTHVLRGA